MKLPILSEEMLGKILFVSSCFSSNSIKDLQSTKKTLLKCMAFYIFAFFLIFGLPGDNSFAFSQFLISAIYPNFSEIKFYKLVNYIPAFIYFFFVNSLISIIAAIIFTTYIYFKKALILDQHLLRQNLPLKKGA